LLSGYLVTFELRPHHLCIATKVNEVGAGINGSVGKGLVHAPTGSSKGGIKSFEQCGCGLLVGGVDPGNIDKGAIYESAKQVPSGSRSAWIHVGQH
jgi:hypothetical protein